MASSDNTTEQYAKDLLFTDGLPIIEEEQGYRGQIAASAAASAASAARSTTDCCVPFAEFSRELLML